MENHDPQMDEIRSRLNMNRRELNELAEVCSGMVDQAHGWDPVQDEAERIWVEDHKDDDDFE